MTPGERDEAFRKVYTVTAVRSGEIYGRRQLINYVIGRLRRVASDAMGASLLRALAEGYIDDHRWMRFRTSMSPNAIAGDILRDYQVNVGREHLRKH